MNKLITSIVLAVVTLTGASAAMAETKPAKPKTCAQFSEATTSTGKIGICAPTKAGGKPTYLRSYTIVEIKDDSGVKTRVMIGFR